jgi:hypothetical protein
MSRDFANPGNIAVKATRPGREAMPLKFRGEISYQRYFPICAKTREFRLRYRYHPRASFSVKERYSDDHAHFNYY